MTLMLNCPGHTGSHGHYVTGCGHVPATIERRKIYVADGVQDTVPVLVCPYCHTRLLPTALEIEHTRGAH